MSDYSYSEIKSMQQRAMERVREMNRNSENALEMAKNEFEKKSVIPDSRPKMNASAQQIKTKHTNMPANLPKDRQYTDLRTLFEKEEKGSAPKISEEGRTDSGGFLESILKEPDRALLTGLLMLLKSEGADEALMMALMYIMA